MVQRGDPHRRHDLQQLPRPPAQRAPQRERARNLRHDRGSQLKPFFFHSQFRPPAPCEVSEFDGCRVRRLRRPS
jgi:hypothetical protein